MPLTETARFRQAAVGLDSEDLASALATHHAALAGVPWIYLGYVPIPSGAPQPALDVSLPIDGGVRLDPLVPFESARLIVTAGLRSSRFAPLLFWEAVQALAPGGMWVDLDLSSRCAGTSLCAEDLPRRGYFTRCLTPVTEDAANGRVTQVFRKATPSPVAPPVTDSAWTFGILTAGPSPRAVQMVQDILALDLAAVEVIVCGPSPGTLPDDSRIRRIDLERPEPRGWISRKKNLIVDAARHEHVCLLHDRYAITPALAQALRAGGAAGPVTTFPQVYYADLDRRHAIRYADYQLLLQDEGLAAARASHVYAFERVMYPAYDDFDEAAFCCGGLYVTTRAAWQMVRQDEALYHCEWEDISFGLACQAMGLPHRVFAGYTAESLTPHPLALTRHHAMTAPDEPAPGTLHVTAGHAADARARPERFKPVMSATREAYYARLITRFNAMAIVEPGRGLSDADFEGCRGLSDVWQRVADRVDGLPLPSRDAIADVCWFLSDMVYRWPNCQVLSWIRDHEHLMSHRRPLPTRLVGWGTGALFHAVKEHLTIAPAYLVDNDPAAWGSVVGGWQVRSPEALRAESADVGVAIFSQAFSTIAADVTRLGDFAMYTADEVTCRLRFRPIHDVAHYFDEVERYYPVLFSSGGAA